MFTKICERQRLRIALIFTHPLFRVCEDVGDEEDRSAVGGCTIQGWKASCNPRHSVQLNLFYTLQAGLLLMWQKENI
jgi:hypothetical protein